MLDFKEYNDKERAYFNQDFSVMKELMSRIRSSLFDGNNLQIGDLDLSKIIEFNSETLVYLTLFQEGMKFIRYGSRGYNQR